MNAIYETIQESPQYFMWAFGVVNILWVLFTYFNKQTHARQLAKLDQQLRLDADRRLKVFELKVNQYESYVMRLDEFGRRQQADLPARMRSIFAKYFKDFLTASSANDREAEDEVLAWFGSQISDLMQEVYADTLKLKSESNRLKLTATDAMIETFCELEILTDESTAVANDLMRRLVEIVRQGGEQEGEARGAHLAELGKKIQHASQKLLDQMRAELRTI
jgi:hypothetical protein